MTRDPKEHKESMESQSVNTTQTKIQKTNDNSQQGGLDLPGQPAGKEGGAPGGKGDQLIV